jgi:hypothetical protein
LASILIFIVGWLLVTQLRESDLHATFAEPIWLFNFAPQHAPDFADFFKVSSKSTYDPSTGYGWSKLEGPLKNGTWTVKSLHWESADNLNLIMRPGPDALARSYATGPAVFTLDLEPGDYDVWLLTGDGGLLEHIPHQSYRILVEDKVAYTFQADAERFYTRFNNPPGDDTISEQQAYNRYIRPTFQWTKMPINIVDGQLSVRVDSDIRDPSLLDLLGDYPWSEQRSGPTPRFGGALNALVVTPAHVDSEKLVERVEALRRHDFFTNVKKRPAPQAERHATADDLQRGYNIFFPDIDDAVFPHTSRPHNNNPIMRLATPGEYTAISFAIAPHQDLGKTQIVFDALTGPQGSQITAADINVGQIRYVADPVNYRKPSSWRPIPGPIVTANSLKLPKGISRQFWITIHVPKHSEPGHYRGNIRIVPALGEPTTLPVELEILPFTLKRPTHLATGLTYFVPIAHAYFGTDHFWQRIRDEFADMRRHNMTSVQLTGMGIDNYDGLDRLFAAYREAGFEQPIYLLESSTAVNLFCKQQGCESAPDSFVENYVETIQNFLAEKERRNWPDLIINFGDEFTNDAGEEIGAELARRLKQIPGIVTGADANGYKEVQLLAPQVSVLAFNGGWDGPKGINKGKRQLLHAQTVEDIKRKGARPWLVNIGKDRFSNGFYYWKMSRLGLQGKMEWIYSHYRALPHNPFDGRGGRSNILDAAVYPGPDDTILSTIPYERMRQGLDDLAYVHTLEELIKNAPSSPMKREAEALVARIDLMIDNDFSKYQRPAADEYRWTNARYDSLRHEISDMIMKVLNDTTSP